MKQPNETNGTNPKDIILEEEFNWNKYQQKVLDKWVNKCGVKGPKTRRSGRRQVGVTSWGRTGV